MIRALEIVLQGWDKAHIRWNYFRAGTVCSGDALQILIQLVLVLSLLPQLWASKSEQNKEPSGLLESLGNGTTASANYYFLFFFIFGHQFTFRRSNKGRSIHSHRVQVCEFKHVPPNGACSAQFLPYFIIHTQYTKKVIHSNQNDFLNQ